MKLKIFQTVPSLDLAEGGGLGVAALGLHRRLLTDGYDSRLITTVRSDRESEAGVTAVRMKFPNAFFYDPQLGRLIEQGVRDSDIVHVHGLYNYFNWCVGSACARHAKPLVLHPHGTLAPWYLQKRWLAKRIVHAVFEDKNFARAAFWRAVSEGEREDILRAVPAARIAVIPNGFEFATFPAAKEEVSKRAVPCLDENRQTLLFLGRIAAVKGLDLLIEAWSRLTKYHSQWQLVIAGPEFERYRPKLEAHVSRLPIMARPLVLGSVAGTEKRNLLNCANLFVLPSRAEGLPIAMVEAMACHVPVVVSSACNFLADKLGEGGWICSPTMPDLAESLSNALGQPEPELRRRGTIAYQVATNEFNWARCTSAIYEWSRQAVRGPKTAATPELQSDPLGYASHQPDRQWQAQLPV